MPIMKLHEFTAREEVAITDRYDAAFAAAGWKRLSACRISRSIPFCSRHSVLLLSYEGLLKGVTHPCFIDIPMAHCSYEKRFTNALEKNNLKNLAAVGLTDDANANVALRMCL
jgi:hypothetical protein